MQSEESLSQIHIYNKRSSVNIFLFYLLLLYKQKLDNCTDDVLNHYDCHAIMNNLIRFCA